jgi:hypothetical protein
MPVSERLTPKGFLKEDTLELYVERSGGAQSIKTGSILRSNLHLFSPTPQPNKKLGSPF